MTVERALRDWYEYRNGGESPGYVPRGYTRFQDGQGQGDGVSPYLLGWQIVEHATKRVVSEYLVIAWAQTLLSGGTRNALIDRAERERLMLHNSIHELITGEYAERVAGHDKMVEKV